MSVNSRSAGTELVKPVNSILAEHWNRAAHRWCTVTLPDLLEQSRFSERTALLMQVFAVRDMPVYYFG